MTVTPESSLLPFGHIAFGAVVLIVLWRVIVDPMLKRSDAISKEIATAIVATGRCLEAASENAKAAASAARETALLVSEMHGRAEK